MTRIYSIAAEDIAKETERVGGDLAQFDVSKVIALDELELRPVGPRDVKLRILAAAAEHNVDHAALADTVNITEVRGGKIYPGNSAVGEVVEVGSEVTRFSAGDVVVTHCNGEPDEYGYPLRIWAYDQPESIGWYGEEAVVEDWQLIPAPLDCGLNLWEIATLPLRAPTAYHLWRRGLGIYRLKVGRRQRSKLNVLGFGGGVSELFLMLAQSEGHNAYFCSGSADRRKHLEDLGIQGIDQTEFNRFASRDDVKAFSKHCKGLTGGDGMHIVCDTACNYNSANLSVRQITLDHVHFETVEGSAAATELYGQVFRPTVHDEVYAFEDLPRCLEEMHQNTQNGIPVVRIAGEMPASVKGIAS
jgi:NADPH:quinone reductase-like Zn-dependent oxidoreductase